MSLKTKRNNIRKTVHVLLNENLKLAVQVLNFRKRMFFIFPIYTVIQEC